MLRILLADDHAAVRRQVREALETETGFEVCAEASTGLEAVTLTASEQPDIVILDLSMPQLNGFEAARQIHEMFPRIEMIILTMYDPLSMMDEVVAAGVRTCILKTDLHNLASTVRSIWQESQGRNRASSSAHAADPLPGSVVADVVEYPEHALTEFERQIVQMLAQAKSNKEIATALSLTVKAVEVHRAAIMRKLKISSIFELVRYAMRNKLVATKSPTKPQLNSLR